MIEKLLFTPYTSFSPTAGIVLILISIWSLVWKGVALWHASQNKEKRWFVVLLVVNTASILEIIYLFVISKKKLGVNDFLKKLKSPL